MRRWLAVTAWIGFVGCADTSPDTAGYPAVRDSAGVRIVDAGAPTASGWHVSSAPRYVLGWGPGDPDFTWIPAGRILPDGGAVLGEGREGRLYWLNAEGAVRATRGQRGEGPGEFQSIAGLVLDGDGVVAFDARLARLTRLSEGDEAFSTRRLFAPLAMASSIDREGRVLLVPADAYGPTPDMRTGWAFDMHPVLLASASGEGTDTLATLPFMRRWFGDGSNNGPPGPIRVEGRAAGLPDGGFAWARSDRPEVHFFDRTGALTDIVRWEEAPLPLDASFRERYADASAELLATGGVDEARIAQRRLDLAEQFAWYGDDLPYWNDFHVDGEGRVWLRDFALPWSPSDRWRVIDPDAGSVAWVEGLDLRVPLDIRGGRVLGVRYDPLDVPAVVMLDLTIP